MDHQKYDIDVILQEMRADYWRNLEAAEECGGVSGAEYLVVQMDGKRYGLLAPLCREILKVPKLIRVPRLPAHLRGIFNLRGEIVAVTDLCPFLSSEVKEPTDSFRLVVVEVGNVKTGLLVEQVEGLTTVEDEQVEPLAEGAAKGVRDLIAGKVVKDEEVLVLLDINRLFERPEMFVDQKCHTDGQS